MAEELLVEAIAPHVDLYRDPETGLAFAKDRSAGVLNTVHPSIDASGSVAGMVDRGYWSKGDHTIKVNGFIYNIDLLVISDDVDRIVVQHCQCGGAHN
ncbi:hypothetical protein [Gordonia malaquae]|uniref:hypothetical protein n=1 Tax=Gordonia malaquae TaxID=410332 RepID=UPI0030182D84